jgi:NitT/TauT family transport system permease protein
MVDRALAMPLIERPEYIVDPEPALPDQRFPARLSLWRRLGNTTPVRQASLLVVIAAIWQIYGVYLANDLVLPTFGETMTALWQGVTAGSLLLHAWTSIQLLLIGYSVAVALATVLTLFAVATKLGTDLLNLLTAMFNPLPAIALLPLALLWFGLGAGSIIFVLVHSVLWPLALNTHAGFLGVGETLRMAGQSFGLRGPRYSLKILVPAAFPSILIGLKIGWAFAWRTLIAAELVFGVSSGSGGLGWFIYENRNQLNIANVFAGLLTVILIGLAVESVIFRAIERVTVRRWGMQS